MYLTSRPSLNVTYEVTSNQIRKLRIIFDQIVSTVPCVFGLPSFWVLPRRVKLSLAALPMFDMHSVAIRAFIERGRPLWRSLEIADRGAESHLMASRRFSPSSLKLLRASLSASASLSKGGDQEKIAGP